MILDHFEILNARYEQGNPRMRFEALKERSGARIEGRMRLSLWKANHF